MCLLNNISELDWQFDIPFWRYGNKKYCITPNQVIANPKVYEYHYNRVLNSDNSHPIDIMRNNVEWILSEILVSIILNDPRIPKLSLGEHRNYDAFYVSKLGKKTIMQIFTQKYDMMVTKQEKSFDEYLKWA